MRPDAVRITYRPLGADFLGQPSRRTQSPFTARWPDTRDLLRRELAQLEASLVVVQIDLPESSFRNDGQPRADARDPANPAVVVSFTTRKHGPLRYQCDAFVGTYNKPGWQANVRAIALGLEALRKVERYGIAGRGEQYTGWRAIGAATPMPAPVSFDSIDDAIAFLHKHADGIVWDYDDADGVGRAFRAAARNLHPDVGGDEHEFKLANEARRMLLDRLG